MPMARAKPACRCR